MIPLEYMAIDGKKKTVDLGSMIDIVRGPSGKRDGWVALITYLPAARVFLELRDAKPDIRGNSRSEAEEVSKGYLERVFGLSSVQISQIVEDPQNWVLLER